MKRKIAPWDSSIMLGPGKKVYMDEKTSKDWYEQRRGLREIRGNIISGTIEIELVIDQIICALLFPPKIKKELSEESSKILENSNELFDSFVLKERPMQFSAKIHLFEKLCSEHSLLKEFDCKELIENLNKIKDIRNKFSHNTIAFKPQGEMANQKLIPVLTCYDREIILDGPYFDSLNELYRRTGDDLNNLLKNLII